MTNAATARGHAGVRPLIQALAPLGFVVTLVGLVSSFVAPFLPLYLSRDLHAGPGLVSLFLFLMPLAAVAVATSVGRVSDRPAMRHRMLVLAAVTGCAGFLLFAVLRNYWASLAVALTLVAVASSLMPQVFAFSRTLLDQAHPARSATGISALRALLSLGWVAGPPVAAYLIGAIDFRGLFIVAAAIHVAVLPVLIRFRDKGDIRPSSGPDRSRPTPAPARREDICCAPALRSSCCSAPAAWA